MSSDSRPDSNRSDAPVVRFLDSFLDEKNIKWVLCTGLLILLGSSVMMVSRGWDGFNAPLKFSIIIGYTAAIFGAGHWSYHRLALRKTGTALLALTVVLIPVSFVAWHYLWGEASSRFDNTAALGLLAVNTVVAAFASRKIFHHFLQGHQTTFLISYLVLSFACAVAPSAAEMGQLVSIIASVALWSVFAVGAVKVNRHVFWLTEEHRKPRIFGFFPILLLGGQFLLVFATNFAADIDSEWFGLGCVLVAIPVLLTADTVAKVFQQRTGDLVRPIPWPIMLPMVAGIILCAAGIGIAAGGFAVGRQFALVPTAAAAAIVMATAAHRTNKSPFAWAMLACMILVYNFSPVFFKETARAVIQTGASAVNEASLPYAFYGLTYLPLIVGMTLAASVLRKRKADLFAKPLQQCSVVLSGLLLLAAFGHAKALLPVAGVMTGIFALQTALFRVRALALAAVFAFLTASVGVVPFGAVSGWELSAQMQYIVPGIAAVLLLVASPWLDRRIAAIDLKGRQAAAPIWSAMLQTSSLVATLALGVVWLTRWQIEPHTTFVLATALIGSLLFVHSLVWTRASVSWLVYILFAGELLRFGITQGIDTHGIAAIGTLLLGVQWGLSYLLEGYPKTRVSQAWSEVNQSSAFVGLLIATLAYALPDMAKELLGSWFNGHVDPWWTRDLLLVAWCFDAALRPRRIFTYESKAIRWERCAQPIPAILGCLCILGFVGCGLIRIGGVDAYEWLPVAWTVTAVVMLPITQWLRRRAELLGEIPGRAQDYFAARAIAIPLDVTMCGVFALFAAAQLVVYTTPLRVAGYVALAGLLFLASVRRQPLLRTLTAILLNWTVLLSVVQLCVPNATHTWELVRGDFSMALPIVAAIAAISVLLWQLPKWGESTPSRDIALFQRIYMRFIALGALLMAMQQRATSSFDLGEVGIGFSCLAFATLVACEFRAALRLRDEFRIWTAEAIAVAALCFLKWFDVVNFGRGIAMFVVLGCGVVLYVLGTLASRRPSASFFTRPLLLTSQWLPLATVGIAIYRHVAYDVQWPGLNSLAILMAGGFYFWHAIERKSKRFAVLSAAILNLAVMLLWNVLECRDPQFYMIPTGISILVLVEVLKREIPRAWHDPLRYAGALTILVSPTFNILGDEDWAHMLSLMVASTFVLLASIGLRIRALMYAGTAFLAADLVAMVIRGGLDHPNLLWIVGIAFGAAVVALGAYCEHNREKLLQRMRIVSTQLQQWS